MGPLFRLVGEICDKVKKVDSLFLFFVANLIHDSLADNYLAD